MKAKKVNESLEFKQGGDPYKKLSLGQYKNWHVVIDLDDTSISRNDRRFFVTNVISSIKDKFDVEAIVINKVGHISNVKFIGSRENLIEIVQTYFYDKDYDIVQGVNESIESLEFKQGGDPYKKLNIGKITADGLERGYHVYGNKGSMWSDKAHIATIVAGGYYGTLCGTGMLAFNSCELMNPGCPECIEIYRNRHK